MNGGLVMDDGELLDASGSALHAGSSRLKLTSERGSGSVDWQKPSQHDYSHVERASCSHVHVQVVALVKLQTWVNVQFQVTRVTGTT